MKEIGGYLCLEKFTNQEYYKDLIPLNNGRNALLYLLRAKKIKRIYIPYYLCGSVKNMLRMNGYDFEFYKISAQFMPIFKDNLAHDEYLYIVNYYGQLANEKLTYFKQKYERIIVDNTHAFFQSPLVDVDTLYSCRKYFGVPDGAYLSTDLLLDEILETDISKDRISHLVGRFECSASEYYYQFQSNEASLDREPLKKMSKLTHNILGAIDYKSVRQKRNENYNYLENKLSKYNILKLKVPDGAFAYPFYLENGINIRRALLNKKIFIPVIWPEILAERPKQSIEYKYAANILPLPCDQRYGIDDMQHVVEELTNIERQG